ncbi:hypothetical protein CAPTEDRAFT_204111 [Capitella teleta]|uniref:Dioxygenase n=1 Tax=Capitella teleta TaxID=283909 RepID=R7UMQ6_CAPTE|nr:hypothetical protein CAPTEDRAFT_204111 [Capitella teleta]|eukprot:ELU07500.1 hypothetical protein CAPTEDRAFT_204111 [Capitella teleta]
MARINDFRAQTHHHHLPTGSIRMDNLEYHPGFESVSQLEMPVINQGYLSRKYCFVYELIGGEYRMTDVRIVKKDLCNRGRDRMWSKDNHFSSEPRFFPKPGSLDEDDGVLFTNVLDGQTGRSYLLILDGQTLDEINTGYRPTWIPYTLHGRFFE